jgi:hypothetical protein
MAGQNQITWENKVNTRTLVVPAINKVSDSDLNEIKSKFNNLDTVVTDPTNGLVKKVTDIENATSNIDNTSDADKPVSIATQLALDEKQDGIGITDETTHLLTPKPIRKGAGDEPDELASKAEVETEINTKVPTISEQFTVIGGQAFFATQFDTSTASNITFTRPRRYAGAFSEGEEKRVTKPSYSPVITVSKTNAKQRCKVELYHSGILVPSFLVPTKPSSPLSTYADQAAMTADFAAQTEGEYYYYTGSTSAWLFDGTQTDSIDNYEEFEEITGWEEWGTKPEWLTVTGDAYLVGADHMNLLKLTYYEFEKLGSDLYVDEVVCEVIAVTNGNMDTDKLDATLVSFMDFNDNSDLSANDGKLISLSPYSEIVEPIVLRSADAQWVSLGSGRFALKLGNTNTASLQSYIKFTMPIKDRLYSLNKISIIAKVRYPVTAPSVNVAILNNHDGVDTSGFSFQVQVNDTVRFRVEGNNRTTSTLSQPFFQQNQFFTFGMRFNGANVSIFAKSQDSSLSWVKILDSSVAAFSISSPDSFVIGNRADESGASRDIEWKGHKVFFEALTDAQMEAQMNLIDAL